MDQSSKIVLLFDYFSMESRNLYESFTNVGIPFTAAVVEDDGFLPEGVNSVYGYFCTQGAVAREEHPRYFNQIQVPEYWRIESTNTSGKVMDKTKERARIFYTEPTNHRLVKIWMTMVWSGSVSITTSTGRFSAARFLTRRGRRRSGNFILRRGRSG